MAACQPPCWGRPDRHCPETSPEARFRRTELEVPGTAGIRPKSVFQIGGAGAVGTGSLRGMRLLHRLHAAGFSIWPFDPPGWPRVVEIYPRLLTEAVNKSSAAARADHLDARHPELGADLRRRAASSEDAFDAAFSALVMARHLDELIALAPATDPKERLEGWIWHPDASLGTALAQPGS